MKIFNVRYSFATNSSSSHSVIIVQKGAKYEDIDSYNELGFGWENFVLASKESKDRYLAAQLWGALNDIPYDFRCSIIKDWLGMEITRDKYGYYDISVDHQSQWYFDKDNITKEFFNDLRQFLQRDDVVIAGGNDNDDEGHGVHGESFAPLDDRRESGSVVIKKDGDYYTFMNKGNGFKTRFSFKDDLPEYTKATVPELLDIKLTQFCPNLSSNYTCREFCYEGSSYLGKHADFEWLSRLIGSLKDMGVLELSLGGGSLEYHPDIVKILNEIGYSGMIANITVFNEKGVLGNPKLLEAVKAHVKGIGISIHNEASIDSIIKLREGIADNNKMFMAHLVMGALPLDETLAILDKCAVNKIPVLLLGYKNVGNGASFQPHVIDQRKLVKGIKALQAKHYWLTISVDTLFLQQYQNSITDLKIPKILTTSPEGKFSMYIDAVEQTMSPSSYIPRDQIIPIPKGNYHELGQFILDKFKDF